MKNKKHKILIVDDNADLTSALEALLLRWGHQVNTALDGASAIKEIEKDKPEIILLDIGLPKLNGYEVVQKIRKEIKGGATIKIIAITGYGSPEDIKRAISSGFDEHYTKPVSISDIKAILNSLGNKGGGLNSFIS